MTHQINQIYARRHNYTFLVNETRRLPHLTPQWEKIPLIANLLGLFDAPSVIFLLDDDAFVYKHNITVESWLQKFPHSDIIIGVHSKGQLNTGAVIIRNTDWSVQFFKEVLETKDCNHMQRTCCWEQDCVIHIMRKKNQHSHFAQVPAADFNCHDRHKSYHGTCDPWIWHAMGEGMKEQLEVTAKQLLHT